MKELPAEMIDAGIRYLHSDPGMSEALLVQGIYEAMSAATGKQQVGEVQGDARAQFEAWAKARGFVDFAIYSGRMPYQEGEYQASHLEALWQGWQAALAARQPVTVEESDYVDVPDIFESARQPGAQEPDRWEIRFPDGHTSLFKDKQLYEQEISAIRNTPGLTIETWPLFRHPPEHGITEEEREWLDYAIAHMRDDNEPEDQTCADVLERMLSRIDGAKP